MRDAREAVVNGTYAQFEAQFLEEREQGLAAG
jgi:hypothetical protein